MILIKLGGGLIAPKNLEAETADVVEIKSLVSEIRQSGKKVIVISGRHKAVKKYGIDTLEGVEKVRTSARKIGEIVWQELNKAGLDGELIEPNRVFGINSKKWNWENTLVMYGDVIEEEKYKWVIYSGEVIIKKLCGIIPVEKIIQVSREGGVWNSEKKIIPEINQDNWIELKKEVGGAAGTDVTGGMLHKVEESLEIARTYGIKTWIISGKVRGRLKGVISGEKGEGTVVG
jgi:isopentenyl phosphate kinase